MARLVSLVSGSVAAERVPEVRERYEAALAAGLPPGMERTYLLRADPDRVAVVSVWRERSHLEAMVAGGQEPLARRLIREAGGEPEAVFYEVLATGEA